VGQKRGRWVDAPPDLGGPDSRCHPPRFVRFTTQGVAVTLRSYGQGLVGCAGDTRATAEIRSQLIRFAVDARKLHVFKIVSNTQSVIPVLDGTRSLYALR